MTKMRRVGARVQGTFIDAMSWGAAVERIAGWATRRESRYVCLTNVHSVVTASQDKRFAAALDGADLALPDGMPVAWQLRRAGFVGQPRLSGPDLMWRYCAHAARAGQSIFLYGSTPPVLAALTSKLQTAFPALRIAGTYAPPFRAEVALEEPEVLERINRSGAANLRESRTASTAPARVRPS